MRGFCGESLGFRRLGLVSVEVRLLTGKPGLQTGLLSGLQVSPWSRLDKKLGFLSVCGPWVCSGDYTGFVMCFVTVGISARAQGDWCWVRLGYDG